jgi:uncharacterized protein (UPF0332 family)
MPLIGIKGSIILLITTLKKLKEGEQKENLGVIINTLRELKADAHNKEPISLEKLYDFLEQYKNFNESNLNNHAQLIQKHLERNIQHLLNDSRLTLETENVNLESLKDLKTLINSLNFPKMTHAQQCLNQAYLLHEDKINDVVNVIYNAMLSATRLPKGLEHHGSKIKLNVLFEKQPEIANQLFEKLLKETDESIFQTLIKDKTLKPYVEQIKNIAEEIDNDHQYSNINNLLEQENENNSGFLNSIHSFFYGGENEEEEACHLNLKP